MHSLRSRFTVTILCVILAALVITTLLSTLFIRRTESHKTDQLLLNLCESGQRSLDYYFDSVENSVLRVTAFVEEDLEGLEDEQLAKHMENARDYFGIMASKTKGVLTYYYRLEPSVSAAAEPWEMVHISKGFSVFNSAEDKTAVEVMKRADQLMYENKRERKQRQGAESGSDSDP